MRELKGDRNESVSSTGRWGEIKELVRVECGRHEEVRTTPVVELKGRTDQGPVLGRPVIC